MASQVSYLPGSSHFPIPVLISSDPNEIFSFQRNMSAFCVPLNVRQEVSSSEVNPLFFRQDVEAWRESDLSAPRQLFE